MISLNKVYSSVCSNKSPGLHFSSLQIASNVENRIALTLLSFNTERLVIEIPTLLDKSVKETFLWTRIKSKFTFIAIIFLFLHDKYIKLYVYHTNLIVKKLILTEYHIKNRLEIYFDFTVN